MRDRLPQPANSEPRDRFLVKTLRMNWRGPVGWAKARLRRAHQCPEHHARWWARRFAPLPNLRNCLLAGLALFAIASPASAQGKLDARYEVTLAGIPVGK